MSTDRKTDLPDQADSAALSDNLDYQDVKLKIVQQEGYDEHDFNLFDDRASVLWRKPYVDGAVQELTAGNTRSEDELRAAVEQMMLAAGDPTRMSGSPGSAARRLRPTSRSTLRSMRKTRCLASRHINHLAHARWPPRRSSMGQILDTCPADPLSISAPWRQVFIGSTQYVALCRLAPRTRMSHFQH
jgi:hypothetical protein